MRENLRENETLFNVFDRFVDAVYLLALTFLLVANVIFVAISLKKKRDSERIDKGELIKVVEPGEGDSDKFLWLAYSVLLFSSALSLSLSYIGEKIDGTGMLIMSLWVITLLQFNLFSKLEIYEKGILYGINFVRWEEIDQTKWKSDDQR
ncbi:MAG: hypothetical protein PWR13_1370 [Archaeoglobi archaeon]|nr:hypothetical protein [Archaeoglobi archaeon]